MLDIISRYLCIELFYDYLQVTLTDVNNVNVCVPIRLDEFTGKTDKKFIRTAMAPAYNR